MGLFTSSVPLAQTLGRRSDDIVGVFTKTVTDLSVVNDKADAQVNANKEAIAALNAENEELIKVAERNNNFIGKIQNLLGLED